MHQDNVTVNRLWEEWCRLEKRRQFLSQGTNALGMAALATLGGSAFLASPARAGERMARQDEEANGKAGEQEEAVRAVGGQPGLPHFPARAKNVIYLHMVGGPSQMDLFDYKPGMNDWYDRDLPESVRNGQRLTTMTSGQARFPIAPSMYRFAQHGQAGMWFSELLPYTSRLADRLCMIRSMHTEAINHEPAITAMQTGNMVTGRPCLGAWVSWGLGSLNDSLPTFVVLVAEPTNKEQIQAISARLWSSGFLPGTHAGVGFRSAGDAILYLQNPPGVDPAIRRKTLDGLRALNEMNLRRTGDPEIHTRIEQYELAFRMQASVPPLVDLSTESQATLDLYGSEVNKPGSFAHTALMARRLVESGTRFVQVYLNNWDHHSNVAGRLPSQCRDIDQPTWGLITDLEQRGLLDSTLVIWGGGIRADHLLTGRIDPGEPRPRPSSALFHDVDVWRWLPSRGRARGNRRVLLQHRAGSGPRPGLPRHDPASAGDRPQPIHLQVPGAGPETDRRRTGPGHPGVDRLATTT